VLSKNVHVLVFYLLSFIVTLVQFVIMLIELQSAKSGTEVFV